MTETKKPSTFVLVHGAWHGGWCWRRVEQLLLAEGHRVFCPTLTGLGDRCHLLSEKIDLNVHITDIVNLISWEELSDIVLVGHSYGGFVISGVAEQVAAGTISSLVFLDAFVPEDGDSMIESITTPEHRSFLEEVVTRGELAVAPPPAAAFNVNEMDQHWVDAKCTPHPIASITQRIRLDGARDRVPRKWYILAKSSGSPNFSEIYQSLKNDGSWHLQEVESGHDAMLDQPEELATLLLAAGA
jgi:pimeloyl-ACP methyl ester carboxylesterase